MTVEELKQLDEDVCAWWSAWTAYKCKTSERHLHMAIQLRHVQALIDAEIERQSVTDQDVQRAIDELIKDITDRRGFRQVWDEIDDDIKAEIIDSWTNIFSVLTANLPEQPIGV